MDGRRARRSCCAPPTSSTRSAGSPTRAADELHEERRVSDATWDELRPLLSDQQLIELCLLVGHYEMLAMTLNSLQVEPDQMPERPSRLARLLQRVAS